MQYKLQLLDPEDLGHQSMIGNVLWVLHMCSVVTLESAAHIFVFAIRPTPHPVDP